MYGNMHITSNIKTKDLTIFLLVECCKLGRCGIAI
jgi:hypothetical protein